MIVKPDALVKLTFDCLREVTILECFGLSWVPVFIFEWDFFD